MLRVQRKSGKMPAAVDDLRGRALAGVVEAGFLMAAADGDLAPTEFETLAGVIEGFTGGAASAEEVARLLDACDEALAREGYDQRITAVIDHLPSPELRRLGLLCSAVVLGADDAFGPQEGDLYVALAVALGFRRDEALDVLDEARALYASC